MINSGRRLSICLPIEEQALFGSAPFSKANKNIFSVFFGVGTNHRQANWPTQFQIDFVHIVRKGEKLRHSSPTNTYNHLCYL